jgi:hypothetical protein
VDGRHKWVYTSSPFLIVLIGVVLLDAFETIVLPRQVARRLWLVHLVLRPTWQLWSSPARGHWRSGERRETSFLSFYGPFALILLIGVWAAGLMGDFALLLGSLGAQLVPARRERQMWCMPLRRSPPCAHRQSMIEWSPVMGLYRMSCCKRCGGRHHARRDRGRRSGVCC